MTLEQELKALIDDWERFDEEKWYVWSVRNALKDLLKPKQWRADHMADMAMDRQETMEEEA